DGVAPVLGARRGGSTGARYCLRRGPHDLEYGLDELLRIPAKLGQTDVVIASYPHAFRKLRENKTAHPFTHFMDVRRHVIRRTMRSKKSVHDSLQTVGLLDDHPGVFAQTRPVEFPLEALSRSA